PVSGKKFWSYPSKYPLLASQLSTAGDLVFSGDPEGNFFALDAVSGKKLWNFPTGSGHRGSAITYSVKGKQYVATPSGWGSALAARRFSRRVAPWVTAPVLRAPPGVVPGCAAAAFPRITCSA